MKCGFQPATWLSFEKVKGVHVEPELFWPVCRKALREIAETGWDGVEVSQPQFEIYFDKRDEFRRLLDELGLELATFYHARNFEKMTAAEAVEGARRKCEFLQAVGSSVLLLDGGHVKGPVTREQVKPVADCANAIAALAADCGLLTSWHIHWGTMFERSAALDLLMEMTDPALVTLCPDTAQMALGDYDLEATFEKYARRISYVHFKDLAYLDEQGSRLPSLPPNRSVSTRGAWRANREAVVLEPGQGVIDYPALWRILAGAGFDGWVVVDLDYSLTTPRESSRVSREYLGRLIPSLAAPVGEPRG